MKNKTNNLFFYLLLISTSAGVTTFAQSADIILTNGKIFTSDTTQLYVHALAIKGNKILATGSNEAIAKLATSHTKKIDLQGKTVIPGINDAHDHLGFQSSVGIGYAYTEMNPAGLSKAAVLDSVSKLVKIAKPNQWISGWIGTTVLFDSSVREALDSIAPNNPVVLQIWWGHGEVVNEKALEVSGISDEDKDPAGGWYERKSPTGKITAIQENAQVPIWNTWLGSDFGQQLHALRSFSQLQLRYGITTVQQMSSPFNAEESKRFFKAADLRQRIRIVAWPGSVNRGRKLHEWNVNTDPPGPLVYFSGVKYMIDGTPLEENAFNKRPYKGGGNWYGRLDYPVDTIRQILKEALNSNRQLMMHIIGDSTLATVLSLMKQMAGDEVWKAKRVRIEHNSTANITPAEVNEVKDLGLLMMHTPKYCQTSPIRSLLEKGITVGISPDGTTNPFWDIMVITSQQTRPSENITREQAVIAYTRTNAFAEFKEKEKGTLTKGMLADLAVLSEDIFSVPTEQLPAIQSVLTIVDGKIVYQ
jgi:predicted amidohydrolase YtcJ